jgi:hypothetical protein
MFQTEESKQKQAVPGSLITAGDIVYVCWIKWMTDVIRAVR